MYNRCAIWLMALAKVQLNDYLQAIIMIINGTHHYNKTKQDTNNSGEKEEKEEYGNREIHT